jgi:hypothetical protein
MSLSCISRVRDVGVHKILSLKYIVFFTYYLFSSSIEDDVIILTKNNNNLEMRVPTVPVSPSQIHVPVLYTNKTT